MPLIMQEVELCSDAWPAGTQAMSDSLMYRLAYYRFADAAERNTGRRGYDRVRNADIGLMDFRCAFGGPPCMRRRRLRSEVRREASASPKYARMPVLLITLVA